MKLTVTFPTVLRTHLKVDIYIYIYLFIYLFIYIYAVLKRLATPSDLKEGKNEAVPEELGKMGYIQP